MCYNNYEIKEIDIMKMILIGETKKNFSAKWRCLGVKGFSSR